MNTAQPQRVRTKSLSPAARSRQERLSGGQELSAECIEAFCAWLLDSGRGENTASSYRRCLERLRNWLPEDKMIQPGTLTAWRQELLARGMAAKTAEFYISAANSMLEYCGRRDLQISLVRLQAEVQPELTRNEYLRLLSAARSNGQERCYLLIKTFGTLGLGVSELELLTVESAVQGLVLLPNGGSAYIPKCLRQELLRYAQKSGIRQGPLFLSARGKPLNRSNVWLLISNLSRDARVAEEKCNPRCLRQLCQQTKDGIRQNLELLGDQMYDRLLEREQATVGWDEG